MLVSALDLATLLALLNNPKFGAAHVVRGSVPRKLVTEGLKMPAEELETCGHVVVARSQTGRNKATGHNIALF